MKLNLALLSILPFFILSTSVSASSNTVQFKGEVGTQTCSVNINGNQSNPVVLLPTVAASQFVSKGSTAGDTTFTVNVTNCSEISGNTAIKTVLISNNSTTNGNLGNAGDAAKVSIQLLDSDGSTPLSFINDSSVTTSSMTLAEGSNNISQSLVARYYAEDIGVTAGSVIATAQFAITYK
ncbi:TPA: fimbrial protein [Serratia marcescens]